MQEIECNERKGRCTNISFYGIFRITGKFCFRRIKFYSTPNRGMQMPE